MAYLAMFHWGWLTGALLLGLAMGWIAGGASRPTPVEGHAPAHCRRAGGFVAVTLARLIPAAGLLV